MIDRSRLALFLVVLVIRHEARAQADTVAFSGELPAFEVVARTEHGRNPSAVTVDSLLLDGFERSGLRSALQWVPGVQVDERGHGGSTRLSMRGSVLRSPFGVRGVKAYWGPLPLTLADGSTPLELLDPILVDQLDVARGVGDARYGAAPCGSIMARPSSGQNGTTRALAEAIAGPFGYYRMAARAAIASDSAALVIGGVRQRNDGYRDQEGSARDQWFLVSRWRRGRSSTQALLTWQLGQWALPGSLDSATAADRPRSARPYAQLIDAHVEKRQLAGGIAQSHDLTRTTSVHAVVGGQAIDKVNPYGNNALVSGYKEERIGALSIRASADGRATIAAVKAHWEMGAEMLWERDRLDERTFLDAEPDSLWISASTAVRAIDPFAAVRIACPRDWSVHASVGSESVRYLHSDLLVATVGTIERGSGLLPMLAIEKAIGPSRFQLRWAESSSRATVWELLGTSGELKYTLLPERWREIEFTASNRVAWLTGTVSAFHRNVNGLITEVQDSTGSHYVNGGSARFTGIESFVQGEARLSSAWRLRHVTTFSLLDATALREERRVEVPGTVPVQLGMLLRLHYRDRWCIEGSARWLTGPTADEAATVRLPDQGLFHARMGATLRAGRSIVEVFVHIENLADTHYSSWVQVNDPGGRYYNPAPPRSLFVGAVFRFHSGR